uniref:DUF2970 domain-containing protein n=1 Tax=mine drainage metagenome TaxID=410659 RepID=E6Q051_9ZZZZ
MKLFDFLVGGFIDSFGITKPDATEKNRASWIVLGMIVGVIVFVAVIFGVVVLVISK